MQVQDNIQLKRFVDDEGLKTEVLAYFLDYFEQRAIEKVFKKEDVRMLPEAFDTIKEAIEHLESSFSKKPQASAVDDAR